MKRAFAVGGVAALLLISAGVILLMPQLRVYGLHSNVERYEQVPILDTDARLGMVSTDPKRLAWSAPTRSHPWPLRWEVQPWRTPNLEAHWAIYLFRHGAALHVTRLAQLQGYVHVGSQQDAETFVHIPYAPDLQGQFSGTDAAAELIGKASYRELGYPATIRQRSGLLSMIEVPDDVLRRFGISSVTVSAYMGGWSVVRYEVSYTEHGLGRIEKVQELIGRDGSYQRRVLATQPLPAKLKPYATPLVYRRYAG